MHVDIFCYVRFENQWPNYLPLRSDYAEYLTHHKYYPWLTAHQYDVCHAKGLENLLTSVTVKDTLILKYSTWTCEDARKKQQFHSPFCKHKDSDSVWLEPCAPMNHTCVKWNSCSYKEAPVPAEFWINRLKSGQIKGGGSSWDLSNLEVWIPGAQ